MQKMDGRTESQTDTELWPSNLIFCTLNKVICKVLAQYVKARRRKVQKTVYFQYSDFQKGHNSHNAKQRKVGYKWSTVSANKNPYYLLIYHAIKLHIYVFHEESKSFT